MKILNIAPPSLADKRHAVQQFFKENSRLKLLLQFFAWMLIFTLIARSTAGAALPKVTTMYASPGTVSQTIDATGIVELNSGNIFLTPQGFLVEEVYAEQGQYITQGEALLKLNLNEIRTALAEKKAALTQQQAQYKQLNKSVALDISPVQSAQASLDTAYKAYDDVKVQYEQVETEAIAVRDAAQASLDELKINAPQNESAIAEAEAALSAAQQNLNGVQTQKAQALGAALQAAQQAENARNQAISAYNTQKETAQETHETNTANAGVIAVNIEELKSEIVQLTILARNSGVIYAAQSGIITSLNASQGAVSTNVGGVISQEEKGYKLRFNIADSAQLNVSDNQMLTVSQGNKSEEVQVTSVNTQPDGSAEIAAALAGDGWQRGAANVLLTLSENKYDFCVPAQALHADNGGSFVYVLENRNTVLGTQNTARKVYVTVLERSDKTAAVTGALTSADAVILSADKPLQEGAHVRIEA